MRLRPDIWLLGLPLAAALGAGAVWHVAPEIESRLRREVLAFDRRDDAGALARAAARVEVEGRDLSVTSDAPLGAEARSDAARVASNIPGLRGPVLRVLAPAAVQRFAFSIRHSGREVVLGGYVPPGELRAELVRRSGAAGANVRDDLRTALGAPDGFAKTAEILADLVLRLEGAAVTLTDRAVEVTGIAGDARSYRETKELLETLPAGYSKTIAILPPVVSPYSWSASREGNRLVLAGNVPSEVQRETVLAAARSAAPALPLEDRMDTARGLEPGLDYDGMVRRLLPVLGRLESGRIDLRGRTLSVDGRLAARDLLKPLEAEIRGARLPGVELDRIELQPVPASPYRFTARRADGRLQLSGYLPDEPGRSAIRDLVRRRFPFDTVADDLHLADGAPGGLAAVLGRALERLSTLSAGEVAVEDRTVRLDGRGLYAEMAARVQRDFGADAPQGWTMTASVGFAGPEKPLDPDFCADLVSDESRRQPVLFDVGKPEPNAAGRKALTALGEIMRRCGSVRIAVTADMQTAGDLDAARQLAERRANAVTSLLAESGIRTEPKGRASKVSDSAKAVERVEFEVRP